MALSESFLPGAEGGRLTVEQLSFLLSSFGITGKGGILGSFYLLHRHGHMLAALPPRASSARKTLGLYAPQRLLPRLLAASLRNWPSLLPLPLPSQSLRWDAEAPLARFFTSLGLPQGEMPGILAGNPHAPGRRLLFVFPGRFDTASPSWIVVKAGGTLEAVRRIRREYAFLQGLPSSLSHIVRPIAFYEQDGAAAFALPLIEGRIPTPHDDASLPPLFAAWLDTSVQLRLNELPLWKELQKASPGVPPAGSLENGLGSLLIHPELLHGDLAPWNIRIDEKDTWQVFDWEHGQLHGIPSFNFWHYHLQRSILVRRLEGDFLRRETLRLLRDDGMLRHLARAGLAGKELAILRLYLLFLLHLFRPTEGRQSFEELQKTLEGKG